MRHEKQRAPLGPHQDRPHLPRPPSSRGQQGRGWVAQGCHLLAAPHNDKPAVPQASGQPGETSGWSTTGDGG